MSLKMFGQPYWTGAALAAVFAAEYAHAQGTPEDATAGLETVVVTADKRNIDLQDVPIAITAVSDETLQQGNITDASALNGYVPGLQINKSGGSERMVSIRGVGSQTPENFFTQPGVSFHIDGVYITNSIALNMGFLDVSRVEVLRGPQGTVFGQSSTGGTINLITKEPVLGRWGGDIEASVGNSEYLRSRASLNVPIGETVALRGVVQKTQHEGYATATSVDGGDYELDDADNLNYKLVGMWVPTDKVSITLSSQRYDDDTHGGALKALDDPDPDERRVTQDFPAKFDLEMEVDTLIVNWELPWGTFKSTSSYQDMGHIQSFDSDRSDFAHFGGYDHVATWTTWAYTRMQEFTLSSHPGGKLNWIVGAFYLNSDSGQYIVEYEGTDPSDPMPVLPRDSTPADMPANLSYENLSAVERSSWAPFFQATYHISDRWRFTGGARYNQDEYDGWGSDYYAPKSPRDHKSHTVTGKAEIDFDVTETSLAYVSWSRGYKPGGVNTGTSSALVVSDTIQQETVDAYEFGSKSRFLDNHLGINVSAFYYDYANMQYIQEDPVPYSGGIGNIPTAEIYGAEAELRWRTLGERLELGFNVTVLDGKFPDSYLALDRRLADAAGDAAVATGTVYEWTPEWFAARGSVATDVSGNTPPNLPSLAGGVNAMWMQPISTYGELTARVEYLYRGDYEARIFNTPGADQVPSYAQVNLFFEYAPRSAPWSVSALVTNVFDEDGVSGRFVDPYGSGVVSNEYIPPRQALLSFRYTF